MRIDSVVVAAAITLYGVLAVVWLPVSEYPRALGLGAIVFAVVFGLGQAFGQRPIPRISILFVGFGATAVLAMPTFPAMGGTHPAAVPIGFLGVQAAMLLWAVACWRPVPPPSRRVSFRQAVRVGSLTALGLSAIAAIPVLIIAGAGEPSIFLVFPGYFLGFLLAASLYWVLQRISHLATGRYLIGVLAGTCVYGAIAPVVSILKHEPLNLRMMLIVAVIAGGFVGPAIALSVTDDVAAT